MVGPESRGQVTIQHELARNELPLVQIAAQGLGEAGLGDFSYAVVEDNGGPSVTVNYSGQKDRSLVWRVIAGRKLDNPEELPVIQEDIARRIEIEVELREKFSKFARPSGSSIRHPRF